MEKYFICIYQFLLDASDDNIDYNDGLTVSNLVRYDLNFRWQIIYNTGRSMFDWFNFIMTVPVVLVLSRSWSYVHIIRWFKEDYFKDDYLKMFKFLWVNLFLGINDLWILPMGMLAFISITRHTRMRNEWKSYFEHTICFQDNQNKVDFTETIE